jgi:hypothetical protein
MMGDATHIIQVETTMVAGAARNPWQEVSPNSELAVLLKPLGDIVYYDYPGHAYSAKAPVDVTSLIKITIRRLEELQRGEAWGQSRRPRRPL